MAISSLIRSHVTGRFYQPADCCFIVNPKQTALYMKNGLVLLDVMVGKDDRLVYVFDQKTSAPLYEKWKSHELS